MVEVAGAWTKRETLREDVQYLAYRKSATQMGRQIMLSLASLATILVVERIQRSYLRAVMQPEET